MTLIEGRSDDQKRRMFREVTDAICRTLDAEPESVRIVINETPRSHFAVAGKGKFDPAG